MHAVTCNSIFHRVGLQEDRPIYLQIDPNTAIPGDSASISIEGNVVKISTMSGDGTMPGSRTTTGRVQVTSQSTENAIVYKSEDGGVSMRITFMIDNQGRPSSAIVSATYVDRDTGAEKVLGGHFLVHH